MTRIVTREQGAAVLSAGSVPDGTVRQDVLKPGVEMWTIPDANIVVTGFGATDLVGLDYPEDTVWVRLV